MKLKMNTSTTTTTSSQLDRPRMRPVRVEEYIYYIVGDGWMDDGSASVSSPARVDQLVKNG